MTDAELKFWGTLATAVAALVVAAVTHFSNRTNQNAIERLREEIEEAKAARNARRDYEYEARKRLYHETILFQLSELCEAAYFRISGLAASAGAGRLIPGPNSYLTDEYYRLSTLYRLLAPSAVLKLLQRRLTLVDLSLDIAIHRQYTLARQVFFAFGDDFEFARLGKLPYKPLDADADTKASSEPAIYWRQGYPLGAIEPMIEWLIVNQQGGAARLMTYPEYEVQYRKSGSKLRASFDEIAFLIDKFQPHTRPVFWTLLVTQAVIYRALSQPHNLEKVTWGLDDLRLSSDERAKFDWRSPQSESDDAAVAAPFEVAEQYLIERLAPRLERITAK